MISVLSSTIHPAEVPFEDLEVFFDSLPEPTFLVDDKGIIRVFNKSYEKLLGIERSRVLGKHVSELQPNTNLPSVLRTGIAEIDNIMKVGGQDAIVHRLPIKANGKIIGAIARVMFRNVNELKEILDKVSVLETKINYYKRELHNLWSAQFGFENIIGDSSSMTGIKRLAAKIANSDSTVLITGESGVGKELYAHAIHRSSQRNAGPFIRVNCAAIPKDLVEAELFGYESGAFTGAKSCGKPGKFEMAEKGSIFLDEIGDMPLEAQVKLLRVLESRELERLGAVKPVKLNVRIIAATNRSLVSMLETGKFREDLYFRINVVNLQIPPLREHGEDIPVLLVYLMNKICQERGLPKKSVRNDVLETLKKYPWPGNVRELANLVEQLMNMVDSQEIKMEDLPPHISRQSGKFTYLNTQLDQVVQKAEKDKLLETLEQAKGNKKLAARLLGIHRSTLYEKLAKYDLYEKGRH